MQRSLVTALLAATALGGAAKAPPLTQTGGWVEAVAPGVTDTSAFMTLKNPGRAPIRITGGSAGVAEMVMPMNTVTSGSGTARMSGMTNAAALVVPARGSLTLKPDGDHLMLMGLKRPLKPGETLALTLKTSAGNVTVRLPVKKP